MRRGPKRAKAKAKADPAGHRKTLKKKASRGGQTEQRLAEALAQQAATSEILRVIASSPTNAQPVFDTIAESAVRLCDGLFSGVFKFDGTLIHFVAHNNWTDEGLDSIRRVYPRAPSREAYVTTAILDRTSPRAPSGCARASRERCTDSMAP